MNCSKMFAEMVYVTYYTYYCTKSTSINQGIQQI